MPGASAARGAGDEDPPMIPAWRAASRALAAWLAAASLLVHASSTTTVDYSDLWWNPAESGWGAGVTLQGDVVFLTIFVYGADRAPAYFVAPDMRPTAPGAPAWQGTLYATTGPWFGGPFNPAAVGVRTVGTATLGFSSPTSGTLAYSVDGANVSKSVQRQSWQSSSLAGSYRGGLFGSASGCTTGTGGTIVEYNGRITVTQSGSELTMDLAFDPSFASSGQCRYTGTLEQRGRIAAVSGGRYACAFVNGPTPVSGTFEMAAIQFSESGFAGEYSGHEGAGCAHTGRFGGLRAGY